MPVSLNNNPSFRSRCARTPMLLVPELNNLIPSSAAGKVWRFLVSLTEVVESRYCRTRDAAQAHVAVDVAAAGVAQPRCRRIPFGGAPRPELPNPTLPWPRLPNPTLPSRRLPNPRFCPPRLPPPRLRLPEVARAQVDVADGEAEVVRRRCPG